MPPNQQDDTNAIKKVAHGRLSLLSTQANDNYPMMALNRATSVPSSISPSFGHAGGATLDHEYEKKLTRTWNPYVQRKLHHAKNVTAK